MPRHSACHHLVVEALPNDPSVAHLSRPCLGLLLGSSLRPVQARAPPHRPDHIRDALRKIIAAPPCRLASRVMVFPLPERRGHQSESYRRKALQSDRVRSDRCHVYAACLLMLPVGEPDTDRRGGLSLPSDGSAPPAPAPFPRSSSRSVPCWPGRRAASRSESAEPCQPGRGRGVPSSLRSCRHRSPRSSSS